MPIRMTYEEKEPTITTVDVDLYKIITDPETLECYGLCWVPSKEYWITVPMFMLTPIKENKQILTEG